jgi:hypothetical protein
MVTLLHILVAIEPLARESHADQELPTTVPVLERPSLHQVVILYVKVGNSMRVGKQGLWQNQPLALDHTLVLLTLPKGFFKLVQNANE